VSRGWGQTFLVAPSDRTRGNGHELKHKKFQLNRRKNFFCEGDRALEQAARGAVKSPCLEIFKTHPDAGSPRAVCTDLHWQASGTR